jgi:hypothetical protein
MSKLRIQDSGFLALSGGRSTVWCKAGLKSSFPLSSHESQPRIPVPLRDRSLLMKVKFFFLLSWTALSHAATCYYPDGSPATSMTPCPDSQSCCGTDQACLSNGLCFGADLGVIYRGSCTDKSWPIAECPRVCYTGTFTLYLDQPGLVAPLVFGD